MCNRVEKCGQQIDSDCMEKLRERNHAAFCICRSVHLSAPPLSPALVDYNLLSSPSASRDLTQITQNSNQYRLAGLAKQMESSSAILVSLELCRFIHTEYHHEFMVVGMLLDSLSEFQHPV